MKPAPAYPHEDPDFAAAKAQAPGLDSDPPVPTVLMAGDTLTVRTISNQSEVYEGLVVDSEGKVHVPVIGPAHVSGLAPQQAERTIEGMMQKVDRFVRVNVLVTAWGGHFATVIGAVVTEGAKELKPGMRVAELLAAAGGPLKTTEGQVSFTADIDGSRLVRDSQIVPINLRNALDGDPRHNVYVHAGDQLFVPPGLGNRIAVLGADDRGGGLVDFRPGMRLTEALAAGGGLTRSSDEEDIRIVRGSLKTPLVYRFDFEDLVDGKGSDMELAPGDVVYVSRHWSAKMADVLVTITPLVQLALTGLSTYITIENFRFQRSALRNQNDFLRCQAATTSGDQARIDRTCN